MVATITVNHFLRRLQQLVPQLFLKFSVSTILMRLQAALNNNWTNPDRFHWSLFATVLQYAATVQYRRRKQYPLHVQDCIFSFLQKLWKNS